MVQFDVTGMSCAACSSRVQKAVSKVNGVDSCSVNLLTNSMGVEGSASTAAIIKAVEDAGYKASIKDEESQLIDRQTPALKRRLISSIGFLLVLMYIAMIKPAFLGGADGYVQLVLCAIVMVINRKFFIGGFKNLGMDTLVALGSSAAFVYSVFVLIYLPGSHLYFESSAMILTLITVGKTLEARSKGKTTDALKSLMKLAPKTAVLMRDGAEVNVPIEEVRIGDEFVVRSGENIPVDGVVLDGQCAVDESALTGESIPVDKAPGDKVSAATINKSGFILCRATRVGKDTTLNQIIKMVSDAAATKAPIAKVADRVSGVFVPIVIAIALVTGLVWAFAGKNFGFVLQRAISVLVISCPCALGLATPVAIMVGSGIGAKNGILFKTSVSLERLGKVATVALDKTGTITSGEPHVTDLVVSEGFDEKKLVEVALALEAKSEHPLAKAVLGYSDEHGIKASEVSSFKVFPGNGLSAMLGGALIVGGNLKFVGEQVDLPEELGEKAKKLASEGKTPLVFAVGGKAAGIIAVADVIKDDSRQAIKELKAMGIRVMMLTGDNRRTAEAIGSQAGVDEVVSDVLPDGKQKIIESLKKTGLVAMVGDGINDAPALKSADIGVAIGASADVAIDAADVVLLNSKISDVAAAIRLSRATLRNIYENLFWAFFYNIIGIPLAAGVWIPLFGWELNPMFAAAAMSLSSISVVSNALRLNLLKIHDPSHDKMRSSKKTEVKEQNIMMEKTLSIEGMMCGHCENRVKKVLEALPQVDEATVSHEKGVAVVKLNAAVPDSVLKKAVEDQDYKVTDIK